MLARGKNFSLFEKRPDWLWDPSRGSFPEVKRPRPNADHSSPSNAEVKNEWSHTSTPPTGLHGVERINFTFTFHFRISRIHLSLVTRFRMHGVIHPVPHTPSWAGDLVITGTIQSYGPCVYDPIVRRKTHECPPCTHWTHPQSDKCSRYLIPYLRSLLILYSQTRTSIKFSSLHVLLLKCTIVFTTSCMLQVLVISSII